MNQEKINEQIFRRLERLEKLVLKKGKKNEAQSIDSTDIIKVEFNMSERAFVKEYGKGLSGPKKFVLMVACLTNGKVGSEISMEKIKKGWSKMTSLLGGKFNTYYSTTAKDNNWADSKKYGIWFLTKDWEKIFL